MLRTLARPLLASAFAIDGTQMLLNSADYSNDAKAITGNLAKVLPANAASFIPSSTESQVRLIGTTKVAASALLGTGKAPRLAAGVLVALQIPTAVARNAFWNADGADKQNKQRGFLTDVALLGGLAIATGDTAGKPGLKWRAQKAMPGKSEQQKMLENAKTQGSEFAQNAQEQAQGLFAKAKDVASQVSDSVTEYVDDHSGEWRETAEGLKDAAVKNSKKATKKAKKAQNKAQKIARKEAKKLSKKF